MILRPYEEYFRTAVRSDYARYPGMSALCRMETIYHEVSGSGTKLNKGCGRCVLRFLKDLGALYFAYKEKKSARRDSCHASKNSPRGNSSENSHGASV